MHEAQDEECDAEEYAVHDAERETRLLHRAIFFDGGRETTRSRNSIGPYTQICRAAGADAGTVGAGDAAEFVHARDEGADEAEVDKGNEEGGSLSGLAPEESEDRPCGCEGGDDEESPVSWMY